MPDRSLRLVIVALFLLSGAAALVYEVLWTRQLSLVFGVTTYAVATVLAAFMGGLALGSWTLGGSADRRRRPLMVYALVEAGIGVYALVVPSLLHGLTTAYVRLHGLGLPDALFALGRAALAAGVLAVPTTLMGASFPILMRYWVGRRGDVSRGAGLLYFVNTAGGLLGCLGAGFYLIEHLGLAATTWVAAATNLVVAALAAAVALLEPAQGSHPAPATVEENAVPWVSDGGALLVLAAIGLSGFAALGYEVLWTRALLRYLYNSTYAFTAILATFLAGIALGSALYSLVLRRTRPLATFAILQALVALGFATSAALFPHLSRTSTLLLGGETIGSFSESVAVMFVRAALVLLAPAICLGASFPLATAVVAASPSQIARSVGRVYGVNTLGSILGSLAAAFVLIPAFGMYGTLRVLVGLGLAAAVALAWAEPSPVMRRLASGVTVVTIAATLVLLPGDPFRGTFAAQGATLLFYREGATDTVGVVEAYEHRSILYDDQRATAGTATYRRNYFLGNLPLLLHPGTPRLVLHICFGAGNSLSAVAAHESVERIDNVELSPHVVEAAPYFWTNGDVLANPKVRTIVDDGRNFVLASRETYDVIMLEPPEIFTAGVINLYTREFYRDALARLAPDGIFEQWIPTGEAPLDEERMLFRAFADVFPYVSVWWELDSWCALLIGSRQPLVIDYGRLRARMREPRVRRDLELAQVADVDRLLSFFTLDQQGVAELVRGVEPVTDDRTVLDFTMPRYIGSAFGFGLRGAFVAFEGGASEASIATDRRRYYASLRRSVVPYLTNLGADTPEAVASRIAARRDRSFAPNLGHRDWQRPD